MRNLTDAVAEMIDQVLHLILMALARDERIAGTKPVSYRVRLNLETFPDTEEARRRYVDPIATVLWASGDHDKCDPHAAISLRIGDVDNGNVIEAALIEGDQWQLSLTNPWGGMILKLDTHWHLPNCEHHAPCGIFCGKDDLHSPNSF